MKDFLEFLSGLCAGITCLVLLGSLVAVTSQGNNNWVTASICAWVAVGTLTLSWLFYASAKAIK